MKLSRMPNNRWRIQSSVGIWEGRARFVLSGLSFIISHKIRMWVNR